MRPSENIKICVLGDEGVGKSSLSLQFTQSHFPQDFDPSIEDVYTKDMNINEKNYKVHVLDTANNDEYSHLKDVQLEQADGFILVYKVNDLESMGSAANSYRHIMRIHGVLPPCILIGNQTDLIHERLISPQEGEELVSELGLNKYFEASAKNNHNVNEAFAYITQLIVDKREKIRRQSVLKEPRFEASESSNDTLPTTKSIGTSSDLVIPNIQKQKTFTTGASLPKESVEGIETAAARPASINQRAAQSSPVLNEKSTVAKTQEKESNKCCIIM